MANSLDDLALREKIMGVLEQLVRMADGIKLDLKSAHYGRIGGTSWMAEDDREQRRDFAALSDAAAALLTLLREAGEGKEDHV